MPKNLADWKSIKDEKEKYNAYLCSREWAEKREAVRRRCNGRCEKCGILNMDACHHLTYARKYNETLDDLQAICNPCHEFTHGKSWFDPTKNSRLLYYASECKDLGLYAVPVNLLGSGIYVLKDEYRVVCEAIEAVCERANAISRWDFNGDFDYWHMTMTFSICRKINELIPFNYSGYSRYSSPVNAVWSEKNYKYSIGLFGVLSYDDALLEEFKDAELEELDV